MQSSGVSLEASIETHDLCGITLSRVLEFLCVFTVENWLGLVVVEEVVVEEE
jgi:hypothetical protein